MAEAARTELELHPGHQAFLDEILSLLRAGQAPSTRPLGDWTSVLDPRLGSLAGKLAAEAPAFACADRAARLARLRLELRRGRIRQTISQLTGGDDPRRLGPGASR